jgi:hypothetical protein
VVFQAQVYGPVVMVHRVVQVVVPAGADWMRTLLIPAGALVLQLHLHHS